MHLILNLSLNQQKIYFQFIFKTQIAKLYRKCGMVPIYIFTTIFPSLGQIFWLIVFYNYSFYTLFKLFSQHLFAFPYLHLHIVIHPFSPEMSIKVRRTAHLGVFVSSNFVKIYQKKFKHFWEYRAPPSWIFKECIE